MSPVLLAIVMILPRYSLSEIVGAVTVTIAVDLMEDKHFMWW